MLKKKKQDYDSEPVCYCSRCYSLKIKYEDTIGADYCTDCGCSDISTAPIDRWEMLYERKYGHKFIEGSSDEHNSYIFKMPIQKLKTKVYEHPQMRDIIHTLYPRFPAKYSRTDAVILLFDKLCKDNRIDDLRLLLLKYN